MSLVHSKCPDKNGGIFKKDLILLFIQLVCFSSLLTNTIFKHHGLTDEESPYLISSAAMDSKTPGTHLSFSERPITEVLDKHQVSEASWKDIEVLALFKEMVLPVLCDSLLCHWLWASCGKMVTCPGVFVVQQPWLNLSNVLMAKWYQILSRRMKVVVAAD